MNTNTSLTAKTTAWLLDHLDSITGKLDSEQLQQELQKHFPFAQLQTAARVSRGMTPQNRMTTEHGSL